MHPVKPTVEAKVRNQQHCSLPTFTRNLRSLLAAITVLTQRILHFGPAWH